MRNDRRYSLLCRHILLVVLSLSIFVPPIVVPINMALLSIDYGKLTGSTPVLQESPHGSIEIQLHSTRSDAVPYQHSSEPQSNDKVLSALRVTAMNKAKEIESIRKDYQLAHDVENQYYIIKLSFAEPIRRVLFNELKSSPVFSLFDACKQIAVSYVVTYYTVYSNDFLESYRLNANTGLSKKEYYDHLNPNESFTQKVYNIDNIEEDNILRHEQITIYDGLNLAGVDLQITRLDFEKNFVDICELFDIIGFAVTPRDPIV